MDVYEIRGGVQVGEERWVTGAFDIINTPHGKRLRFINPSKASNWILNPIRRVGGGWVFLGSLCFNPDSMPGWSERHLEVLNVLDDGVLAVSTKDDRDPGKVFVVRNLPARRIDGDEAIAWLWETDRLYQYRAVSGSKKTVRVLDYGETPELSTAWRIAQESLKDVEVISPPPIVERRNTSQ